MEYAKSDIKQQQNKQSLSVQQHFIPSQYLCWTDEQTI